MLNPPIRKPSYSAFLHTFNVISAVFRPALSGKGFFAKRTQFENLSNGRKPFIHNWLLVTENGRLYKKQTQFEPKQTLSAPVQRKLIKSADFFKTTSRT
jgi:hypothetical protein